MKKTIEIAIRTTIITLALTGFLYPLLVTVLAQVLFPWKANGTLVTDDQGNVVGSQSIAQAFNNPAYFRPRPSAAGEKGYDATSSGGSNLGPTSKKLQQRIVEELAELKNDNPEMAGPVPVELVTASGSGLDPHISPQAAFWQIPRVARARRATPEQIEAIVQASIERPQLGFLGEPRVNVLLLNLTLNRVFGPAMEIPSR